MEAQLRASPQALARMPLKDLVSVDPPLPKDFGGNARMACDDILARLAAFATLWTTWPPFLSSPAWRFVFVREQHDAEDWVKKLGVEIERVHVEDLREAIIEGRYSLIRELREQPHSRKLWRHGGQPTLLYSCSLLHHTTQRE